MFAPKDDPEVIASEGVYELRLWVELEGSRNLHPLPSELRDLVAQDWGIEGRWVAILQYLKGDVEKKRVVLPDSLDTAIYVKRDAGSILKACMTRWP